MLYKQTVNLPIIFQLDEDNIDKIGFHLKRNFLNFKNVVVLSGVNFSFPIAKKMCAENKWEHISIDEDANHELVNNLKQEILRERYSLIIGVGGGNIIDIGKRISFLTNINFIAAPTIISNDGLISPISVIRNADGIRESLPGQMPMGIVVDLSIIAQSPEKYLKASAGDILTNLSATNDWVLAYENNGDKINDIAYHLSRNSALNLIYFSNIINSIVFIAIVIILILIIQIIVIMRLYHVLVILSIILIVFVIVIIILIQIWIVIVIVVKIIIINIITIVRGISTSPSIIIHIFFILFIICYY